MIYNYGVVVLHSLLIGFIPSTHSSPDRLRFVTDTNWTDSSAL